MPTASHTQRLNVFGCLQRHNDLVPYLVEGKGDTSVIVECFPQWSPQIDKKTSVLLENAPVHSSQAFLEQMPTWVKQGLLMKYVPSYAPELHRLEIVWRFMQYYWLPFSASAAFPCLVEAIEAILTRFGTEYTLRFQAA